MGIFWLLVIGLVAGGIARAVLPGEDKMGIGATVLLGVVGSFVGGLIGSLFGPRSLTDLHATGIVLSVVGSIVALLVYRRIKARPLRGSALSGK